MNAQHGGTDDLRLGYYAAAIDPHPQPRLPTVMVLLSRSRAR